MQKTTKEHVKCIVHIADSLNKHKAFWAKDKYRLYYKLKFYAI